MSRVISFTGSTQVGQGVAANADLKRVGLELGGNGPLVILDDVDLEHSFGGEWAVQELTTEVSVQHTPRKVPA